ncbi:putative PHD finger and SET domain protein [Penicillium brasilianum]|uniref:Putative PHD finger and SET domain protein n=1 Tax=Penicillium brasilianum TaxID=104259 RepID=A0A1S9RKD5_PENBI|nr:putative PHD finger and SET domain protein [Penicillium brasilianum]
MTDTSSLAITYATTDPYPVPVPASLGSPIANGAISDSVAPDEEEPYTIKCICAFDDDDGNTVFCEGCETWQHIICYYPDKRVPDVHNCVDCEPRQLDARRAAERQRQRRIREQSDDGDRKKRSTTKSQRKKVRDGDVNGFGHQRSESGARDQPPAKKTKTGHRSSASISALAGTPTLPAESRKRRSSTSVAPSPTKPPAPFIPLYSNEFLRLYDCDDKRVDMDSNLFDTVNLLSDTASWVKDPEALSRVTNGGAENTFNRSDAALDKSSWPALTTDTITDPSVDIGGKHPTWKFVKTLDAVQKDHVVGEITGKVGIFDDYCRDPNNRWPELRHPEPFVFFSSHLPLYIDSRHEGSILRYTRRSCRPNVTMKIFITNDVEYHFCFVAKEDIPANSEITIMWYLDSQFFESTNGLVKQEDSATEAPAICISNTLANFGGCACDQPNCLLASLDRRRNPKLLESSKQSNGKRKKVKTKSIASPHDTGRASTSRAGSETTKHPEEDDGAIESRSTSGSARGQPRSRDLSPAMTGPAELSTREKRKIADAEKQFQQLEQLDHRPTTQRKKKRVSGPLAQTSAGVSTATQAGSFGAHRNSTKSIHLETPGRSRSPTTAMSPGLPATGRHGSPRKSSGSNTPYAYSPLGRPTYVNIGIQCDMDEVEYQAARDASPHPRTTFVPRTVRILQRFKADRLRAQELARQQLSSAGSDSVVSARSSSPALTQSPITKQEKSDVIMSDAAPSEPLHQGEFEMQDASHDASHALSSDLVQIDASKPVIPPPWPSTAAHNTRLPGITTPERANLRVSMPPPSIPNVSVSPSSMSAVSLASPNTLDTSPHATLPTPGAVAPTPTPAKKKLSLGDYLIRRGTMATPTSEKIQSPTRANAVPSTQKSPSTPGVGPVASADGVETPTKPSPDGKSESLGSPDVSMKDAPESTQPRIPSISS